MAEENLDGQTNTDSAGADTQADVTTETEQATEVTDQVTTETTEEAKDGEGGDPKAEEVPESYEFEVPEGMTLDQGLVDAVTPVFKDLNLTQEQASKLTAAYAQVKQQEVEAQTADFQKQLESWAGEIKSDKEVGGEAFDKNVAIAQSAISKFGGDDLKTLLDNTGFGNHPAIFKFALNVGKLIAEDQPGSGDKAVDTKPIEQRLYPNM